jgi:hypothetical protein
VANLLIRIREVGPEGVLLREAVEVDSVERLPVDGKVADEPQLLPVVWREPRLGELQEVRYSCPLFCYLD